MAFTLIVLTHFRFLGCASCYGSSACKWVLYATAWIRKTACSVSFRKGTESVLRSRGFPTLLRVSHYPVLLLDLIEHGVSSVSLVYLRVDASIDASGNHESCLPDLLVILCSL